MSVASDMEGVMAKFKPKASAKARLNQDNETSDAQVESKRNAAKRNRMLNKAPDHVKKKWEDLCNLKGRDRNKAEQKRKFTDKLFADTLYEDCYWETVASDTYTTSGSTTGSWILRSKAETQHGGGEKGEKAIDDAIALGIYREHIDEIKDKKTGKKTRVSRIQVREEEEKETHDVKYGNKARAGGKISEEDFKDKAAEILCDDENKPILKRPAANNDVVPLALQGKVKAEDASKGGKPQTILKRPAAMKAHYQVVAESKQTGITQEQLDTKAKEDAAQNERVNDCIVSALKQSRDLHMKIASCKYRLQQAEIDNGTRAKVRDIHVESCTEILRDLEVSFFRLLISPCFLFVLCLDFYFIFPF